MIYLITGTPGTGKTAFAVSAILNNRDGLFKYEAEDGTLLDRPLYFCHIDGLDEKALKAHRLTEEQIQAAPLNEIVPEGSVIIVDECDYCYPLRAAAREVPPYIKTLKELRHHGFTLILMTQHPSMIDSYIRNLVGKHWHLERKQIGTKLYEFNRCETNLSSHSALSQAVSEFYKPDKKAFKYYKSASKHIKFKKAVHPIFYGAALFLLILPFFLWYAGGNLGKYFGYTPEPPAQEAPQGQEGATEGQPSAAASYPPPAASQPLPPGAKAEDYYPRIHNMQETAPLYDNVRQVQDFPRLAGCVAASDSCTCYSQQASPLTAISETECRAIVENRPFDPYRPQRQDTAVAAATAAPPSGSVYTLAAQGRPSMATPSPDVPNMAQ